MSQSTRSNTYDERYVPLEASRRGAHRARRNPLLGILPFALIAVVVLGVAFGAYTVFGPGTGTSSSSSGANAPAPDDQGAPSIPDSAGASASPSTSVSTSPADSPSGSPSASTDTTAIDKDVKLIVLNSTNTSGLAKKAATALKAKDWTIGQTSDYPGSEIDTTVFYADSADKATAQAAAADLGFDLVKKSTTIADKGITVVVGSDYIP